MINENKETNTLDPLTREELPVYAQDRLSARDILRQAIEREGWPEWPKDIKRIEDFFEAGKKEAERYWKKYAKEFLANKLEDWAAKIPANEETESLIKLLRNYQEVEDLFLVHQFNILEDLRKYLPEAWYSLLALASEKQQAEIVLTQHWLEQINEAEIKKWGVESKAEVGLIIEMAAMLGKHIDEAYIKQTRAADQPGGSQQTPLNHEAGAMYLYDKLNAAGKVEIKSYSEFFLQEIAATVENINLLAEKVRILLAQNQLPASYVNLPDFLAEMAQVYGSTEKEPKKVDQQWLDLYKFNNRLIKDGCPLIIIPQGTASVAGEANKVDIELRIAFITKADREKENKMEWHKLKSYAKQYIQKEWPTEYMAAKLEESVLSRQFFAFGSNLSWETLGEESDDLILIHLNAIEDYFKIREKKLAEKIFNKDFNFAELEAALIIESLYHEWGHWVGSVADEKIREKIGADRAADFVEELKAQTQAIKIFYNYVLEKGAALEMLTKQMLVEMVKMCSRINEFKPGSSVERYYWAETAMLKSLLENGWLKKEGDYYKVGKEAEFYQIMNDLADEVLEFYKNPAKNNQDVNDYFLLIQNFNHDLKFKEFVKTLEQ